jgi:hypothetical protein
MALIDQITEFYLNSGDFNGIPLLSLLGSKADDNDVIEAQIIDLINGGQISLAFGDRHPNPHVKAFEPEAADQQIKKLTDKASENACFACVYPERPALISRVDPGTYVGRPFSLRLALGEPQLSFETFDLTVLETYRRDPRYHFDSNDIAGWISIGDPYVSSDEVAGSDKTLLQTFGFCFDRDFNRGVAVFLRYLHGLTPEHQRLWEARIIRGSYDLHPDYLRSTMGEWPEKLSLFDAFLMELRHINEMCTLIGKPPLFGRTPDESSRPRDFAYLLRPTVKEFQDFVSLLDKLMSDNLNKQFFEGTVATEEEFLRADNKVEVRPKGTIRLLDEWITGRFRTPDPEPLREMVAAFKEVRMLRQRPAHALDNNVFDQSIFKEQRRLMIRAYGAVRTLRQVLANHPRVKGYKVSEQLYRGDIWPY